MTIHLLVQILRLLVNFLMTLLLYILLLSFNSTILLNYWYEVCFAVFNWFLHRKEFLMCLSLWTLIYQLIFLQNFHISIIKFFSYLLFIFLRDFRWLLILYPSQVFLISLLDHSLLIYHFFLRRGVLCITHYLLLSLLFC